MNEVIYIIAALAVGFLFGTIFEVFIDTKTIRELSAKNTALETENTLLLEKVKPEEVKIIKEIIISDDTVGKKVDFSQKW